MNKKFAIAAGSILTLSLAFALEAAPRKHTADNQSMTERNRRVSNQNQRSWNGSKQSRNQQQSREKGRNLQRGTIIEVVTNDPTLSTLAELLSDAELVDLLQSSGPYTLFAPNDAAFAKLSPNLVDDLENPRNKRKLADILKYHIISGTKHANDINTAQVRSLNGKNIDVKRISGVNINQAKIVKSDIDTSNGVIHVIDAVLIP